jgi:hypothetical protein
MNHWEFSHLPFDGDVKDDKIVCQNCGWSWRVQDGGNDLFMCHKCNYDNSVYYSDANYSNFTKVDPNAVIGGVTALASLGGSLAQGKANKELSKSEIQKEIDARCGKDKSRSWSKKKKNEYLSCKQDALNKISKKEQDINTQKKLQQESEQEFKQKTLLESQKTQRNQTYIIAGVIVFAIIGLIVYKKMN